MTVDELVEEYEKRIVKEVFKHCGVKREEDGYSYFSVKLKGNPDVKSILLEFMGEIFDISKLKKEEKKKEPYVPTCRKCGKPADKTYRVEGIDGAVLKCPDPNFCDECLPIAMANNPQFRYSLREGQKK